MGKNTEFASNSKATVSLAKFVRWALPSLQTSGNKQQGHRYRSSCPLAFWVIDIKRLISDQPDGHSSRLTAPEASAWSGWHQGVRWASWGEQGHLERDRSAPEFVFSIAITLSIIYDHKDKPVCVCVRQTMHMNIQDLNLLSFLVGGLCRCS